ncbi:unnamed protein product [Lactuca virosa]|uniref:Uncharacterized protein n=1 Tax=Lactuca virosa TaxID=75947 RepID=A0AAU9PUF8_9ASTR|nr:unnamed protein product [Lactuca virosa]
MNLVSVFDLPTKNMANERFWVALNYTSRSDSEQIEGFWPPVLVSVLAKKHQEEAVWCIYATRIPEMSSLGFDETGSHSLTKKTGA